MQYPESMIKSTLQLAGMIVNGMPGDHGSTLQESIDEERGRSCGIIRLAASHHDGLANLVTDG